MGKYLNIDVQKKKREIKICSFCPQQIYVKYLDADKMRDKVEIFHLKYLDVDKMRGKVP